MKNLKNTNDNAVKTSKTSRISQKHDVNLPKNSSLYFQIGLILSLLATYGLFEMNFERTLPYFSMNQTTDENNDFYLPEVVIEPNVKPQEQPEVKVVKQVVNKDFIIKKNDFVIKDPIELVTPESLHPVVTDNPNPTKTEPNTTENIPSKAWNMIDVERVPVFPGCESATNNAERMACMSEKLTKLIQKKFNTDLAVDLNLSGVQKIQVQFTIDNKGRVTDIKTRSPYSQLEQEAERVVSKIPVMTPGMQRETPVSVIYNLPIVFKVQ
ncbi:MAG: energy transducer TonB [Gelidibacter sp.]